MLQFLVRPRTHGNLYTFRDNSDEWRRYRTRTLYATLSIYTTVIGVRKKNKQYYLCDRLDEDRFYPGLEPRIIETLYRQQRITNAI